MDNLNNSKVLALEYQLWLKEHLFCLLDSITWFDRYNRNKTKSIGDKIGIGDVEKGLGRVESEVIGIDKYLTTLKIEIFNNKKDFHFVFIIEKTKNRLYSFRGHILKNKYGIAGSEFKFVKNPKYQFINEDVFYDYIEKQMRVWFPYNYI